VKAFALPDGGLYHQDNVSLVYTFSDGSVGVIDYLANGNKNFSKERIEAFSAGKIAVLDDFRTIDLVSENDHKQKKSVLRQDKGHQTAWQAFANAVAQGQAPTIPYEQLMGVTRASFAAIRSLESGTEVKI
jgi:predicted dehydrogenase